jgi:hypothetical protein
MTLLRRLPILAVALVVAGLAFAGCGGIGSNRSPNSGAGDDNSFYRAHDFESALKAIKGKVGPGGDVLEIRVEAKRTSFTVRKGKTESATGYSAPARDGGDLSNFAVDVVGEGSLANQSIPASDITAAALTRMEAEALKRDPKAKMDTIQFFELAYDPASQRPEWDMNVHGRLYLANLDGTNVHSPGVGAGTLTNPELTPVETKALKLSHCISQAAGDVQKIQRCQRKYLK